MKNGNTAGPSGVVSEMVSTEGEAGVDLVNQIIVEGVIPA